MLANQARLAVKLYRQRLADRGLRVLGPTLFPNSAHLLDFESERAFVIVLFGNLAEQTASETSQSDGDRAFGHVAYGFLAAAAL